MSKRVCVFVDGENFRHAIGDLFEGEFDKNEYLPKKAQWAELFDWLVQRGCSDPIEVASRLRAYWYVVQTLDVFPYKFPDAEANTKELKALLSKDMQLEQQLGHLQGDQLRAQMEVIVDRLRAQEVTMRRRFDGWIVLQDGIAKRHRAIEFRRAGAITYNLFTNQLGSEKAVDVKLATDLIILRDIYDTAIIISGDQDYVPAVQVVKDSGKSVVNVAFKTRSGQLLPGGARRLNQMTDWSLEIAYAELKSYLRLAGSQAT